MNRIFGRRGFSSDRLENELRKIVMEEKRDDLMQRISFVWAVGVIPFGLFGAGFGVREGIKETRHESLVKTTLTASGLGLIGGMAGIVGWTFSPLIAPVMGLSYLDKRKNSM